MSTIDPGKLKVVELRAELASRGLDSKGNKPVLVQRLKEALEKESDTILPNTTILDTSTEEGDTSINEDRDGLDKDDEDSNLSELKESELTPDVSNSASPKAMANENEPEPMETTDEVCEKDTQQTMEEDLQPVVLNESSLPSDSAEHLPTIENKSQLLAEPQPDITSETEGKAMIENSHSERTEDSQVQPSTEITQAVPTTEISQAEPTTEITKPEPTTESRSKPSKESQQKGEKRRRNSPSPQRVQRRRSKSPIREDEPEWDAEKVLLSWYDSDLNLQIDKHSLLSAKPFSDGAFGYAWAGARTTHGAKVGKVCYEVKITEELKWEDIIKQLDKRREHQRADRRDKRRSDRRGRDSSKKEPDSTKQAETTKTTDDKEKVANENDTATESTEVQENIEKPAENVGDEETKEDKTDANISENTEGAIQTDSVVASQIQEAVIGEKIDNPEVKENGSTRDEKPVAMEVDTPVPAPIAKHVFRCGWSVLGTSLQLGESKSSYAFDSQGKFVHDTEFVDYGVPFAVGDVIGAYANINEEKVELTYTINGVTQGTAIIIPRSDLLLENFALFPHILSRNLAFELNLGSQETPWFSHPSELSDYIYIQAVEDKLQGPTRPAVRSDCEVILMCGLPASGKTHWVQEIVKENADKIYTIIGTNHLLQKMTNNGKPLKENYKSRWNIILDRLMKCINTLVDKAGVRRRNFIIDQTNVFPSAQRRKMRLFEGFKRRAVIVVVSDEEQAKRSSQQEAQEGKDVADSTLLEMKANMNLPKSGDWLEEVQYVELSEEEAKAVVQKYNSDGKAAGFGSFSHRGGYRDNRSSYRWNRNNSRRDFRDNYRDGRSYQNNRYRPSGGYQDRRPPGNWNRDYRDNRGPARDNDSRSNRPGGGRHDRSNPRDRNPNGSYRSSRPQGNRNNSNWQGGGGSWQDNNAWGGSQGGYQNYGQGSWSGQSQWKGGSYGQGGYGQGGYSSWDYYGQYANN